MKRVPSPILVSLVVAAFLSGCSGPPGGSICTTNCGGGGNGSVLMTFASTPLTPPAGTSILSASLTISGVILTPATGTAISLTLPGTTLTFDATRVESDSAFVGSLLSGVPAGSYTSATLSVTSSSVTYCAQPNPGIAGCLAGSTATVTGGAAAPVITTPVTVTTNATTSLRLLLNMANALTLNSSTQVVTAFNLAAANVFSIAPLPPAASSLTSGQVDFVEDFTGIVTTVSASSVTVATSKHGSISAIANSSTFFSPNCSGFGFNSDISCVRAGQLASISAALNSSGTFTLLEYDPLETTASDWIEGVVNLLPTSPTQFEIVVNDAFLASSGSLISSVAIGNRVTVNLATGARFGVDTQGLNVPTEAFTFESAGDTSVLRPGQTVAVHIANFAAAVGLNPAVASTDFVGLRFSRVTGSVLSSAPPNVFFIQGLPPYWGISNQLQVQLNQAIIPQTAPTSFDGVADASGISSGQTISIRALYFGPTSAMPFTAAKVRTH